MATRVVASKKIGASKGHSTAHVGLPKTGSTFLQKRFFSQLGRPFFSTEAPFSWPGELGWIFDINRLWLMDIYQNQDSWSLNAREAHFASHVEGHRGKWEAGCSRFASNAAADALISAEGLCAFSLATARYASEMLRSAGIGKIVFIYRRQTEWAVSLWRQMVLREDRFAKYVPFERLFGGIDVGDAGAVEMDWAAYVAMYDQLFGEPNVLVVPYELLVKEPDAFFHRLNVFLEVSQPLVPDACMKENPSLVDTLYLGWKMDGWWPLRHLPKVRMRLHHHLTPWIKKSSLAKVLLEPSSMVAAPEVLDAVQQRYAASNRRLAQRTGYDLGKYGYY